MFRKILLATAATVLAGCSGGPTVPPPELTYTPAIEIPPPQPVPLSATVPIPHAGVATELPALPKPYRSATQKLAAEVKKARRDALDCPFEGAIMSCPYQEGMIHDIVLDGPSRDGAVDATPTKIFLEPGEPTPEVVFDKTSLFAEVTGGGVDQSSMRAKRDFANGIRSGTRLIVTIKALRKGYTGDIALSTGWRTYLLRVVVPGCAKRDEADFREGRMARKCGGPYNPAVQWTYVSEKPAVRIAEPQPDPASEHCGIPASTRYDYSGSADYLPDEWTAYSDGSRTCILPPARLGSRSIPQLASGAALRYWVDPSPGPRHGLIVIEGLPDEVHFRRGSSTMTIRKAS